MEGWFNLLTERIQNIKKCIKCSMINTVRFLWLNSENSPSKEHMLPPSYYHSDHQDYPLILCNDHSLSESIYFERRK